MIALKSFSPNQDGHREYLDCHPIDEGDLLISLEEFVTMYPRTDPHAPGGNLLRHENLAVRFNP